jgi:hypothetical protein
MYQPPRAHALGAQVEIPLVRCATKAAEGATYGSRSFTVKTAIRKATEVIVLTADLYRELALSALRLVPGRR